MVISPTTAQRIFDTTMARLTYTVTERYVNKMKTGNRSLSRSAGYVFLSDVETSSLRAKWSRSPGETGLMMCYQMSMESRMDRWVRRPASVSMEPPKHYTLDTLQLVRSCFAVSGDLKIHGIHRVCIGRAVVDTECLGCHPSTTETATSFTEWTREWRRRRTKRKMDVYSANENIIVQILQHVKITNKIMPSFDRESEQTDAIFDDDALDTLQLSLW